MKVDKASLLLGVLIGTVLSVIMGTSGLNLVDVSSVIALCEAVFRAVDKPKLKLTGSSRSDHVSE